MRHVEHDDRSDRLDLRARDADCHHEETLSHGEKMPAQEQGQQLSLE
jgi:hypothetical protein